MNQSPQQMPKHVALTLKQGEYINWKHTPTPSQVLVEDVRVCAYTPDGTANSNSGGTLLGISAGFTNLILLYNNSPEIKLLVQVVDQNAAPNFNVPMQQGREQVIEQVMPQGVVPHPITQQNSSPQRLDPQMMQQAIQQINPSMADQMASLPIVQVRGPDALKKPQQGDYEAFLLGGTYESANNYMWACGASGYGNKAKVHSQYAPNGIYRVCCTVSLTVQGQQHSISVRGTKDVWIEP